MARLDDPRSPVMESGSGKLQLKNETAFDQVRSVISAQSSFISAELKNALLEWRDNEVKMNKETKGEYKIAWEKLETLIQGDEALRGHFLGGCEDFREYNEGIETGAIVPSPTPPPASVIVTRQQTGTKTRVAAIYGRRQLLGVDSSAASSRRRPSGPFKLKIGNGKNGE